MPLNYIDKLHKIVIHYSNVKYIRVCKKIIILMIILGRIVPSDTEEFGSFRSYDLVLFRSLFCDKNAMKC